LLLKQAGLVASSTAAYRLLEQGGVKVNGEKISDPKLSLRAGEAYLVQVGKRSFLEITLASRSESTR
jgi:tyrosyl-tRNA synthetase